MEDKGRQQSTAEEQKNSQPTILVGKMWSKSCCFLPANEKAVAYLVGGFRFATAGISHCNGSTSRPLFGRGYVPRRREEKSPSHSIKSWWTRDQTYGQYYGVNRSGHPSPYSVDHPMNVAPARFAVEEYNKKKDANLHFVRVVEARQMLCDGDFVQNVNLEAVDEGVAEMYNARVVSRFGCNMNLISFDGGKDNKHEFLAKKIRYGTSTSKVAPS